MWQLTRRCYRIARYARSLQSADVRFSMMMEQFERLISTFNKAAPAPTFGIAIATTLVIFLPDSLADTLGILEFRISNQGAIGWVFILTCSYLVANVLWKIKDVISDKITKYTSTIAYQKKLHDLTASEKSYLLEFMDGENTLNISVGDGVVGGLLAKGIVFQSSDMFDMERGIPYNLQTWARKYLSEHPEYLEGAKKRENNQRGRIYNRT